MNSSTLPVAVSGQPTPPVFHWIMTVQLPNGIIETHDGLHTPESSAPTRSGMFNSIIEAFRERFGVHDLAVLFYDLTINDVSGAAR